VRGWGGSGGAGFDEDVEDLADGSLAAGGPAQREMPVDLVVVAAAVLVLDEVARVRELGGDSRRRCAR
jgi:microcompartment protein CcmK/EutM